MRLGFVGVGKHAQKMAAAFRECGAAIVCFDRGSGDPRELIRDPVFGSRMPWASQVLAPGVDAIVCCAPPDMTFQVAAACLDAAKPCCATKPLMWEKLPDPSFETLRHVMHRRLYVDLWRLYSPAWLALKADLRGKVIKSVHVDFYGNGPVRGTHSGLLDYGPHALAFLLDLGLRPELSWRVEQKNKDCGTGREQWTADGYGSARSKAEQGNPLTAHPPTAIMVKTGNEAEAQEMTVLVSADGADYRWSERDQRQAYGRSGISGKRNGSELTCDRDLALRNFCRAFLAGEPSDTLRISCEAMRLLRQAKPW